MDMNHVSAAQYIPSALCGIAPALFATDIRWPFLPCMIKSGIMDRILRHCMCFCKFLHSQWCAICFFCICNKINCAIPAIYQSLSESFWHKEGDRCAVFFYLHSWQFPHRLDSGKFCNAFATNDSYVFSVLKHTKCPFVSVMRQWSALNVNVSP